MPNWRPDFQPEHLYFVTTTAVDHARLFKRDVIMRLLVDMFDHFRTQKQMKLFSFVVMPNHLHWIAQFSAEDPLADVVRDLKHQLADRIVRQLKAEGNQTALEWLASRVKREAKQSYKVWEDGYLAKDVVTEDFLLQKVQYIHNNPCQDRWQLCASPAEYLWSSARFYLTDDPCIIPIDDFRKLMV